MARHNSRNLKIWKESLDLVKANSDLTKSFPKEERFDLISQMNRSSISIPSNIAKGTAKSSNKHFKIFLENSLGSTYEWETQLEIAKIKDYVKLNDYENLKDKISQIQRMIGSFIDRFV